VAEGWGSYRQTRSRHEQTGRIELRYGQVRLITLAFETADQVRSGGRVEVTLRSPVVLKAGEHLDVTLAT
jgi:hypothetical protein